MFMVEHNGMWMKLEKKLRMLTRSMAPANTTQTRAGRQRGGPRSRDGAIRRLAKCGRVRFETRPVAEAEARESARKKTPWIYTGNLNVAVPGGLTRACHSRILW